jgi:hypothetical protein
MDGDEVASGSDCTVISGTRLTLSKSFARVLASSVRLGLACCGEMTLVVVSGARTTPDMSPAGVLVSSTRSTADEVPPPTWPQLPRLLLLRRGRRRDKPKCHLLPGHGCPSPDGLARDGTQGGKRGSCYPAPGGCARSRVYKRSRERERVGLFVSLFSRATLSHEGPGPPFYRCKERVQVYNGGVAMR